MLQRLVASLLDVRYGRRLAGAFRTWACDLEIPHAKTLRDCIATHLHRFATAAPVFEIRHERVYVLADCFYLPYELMSRRELKTISNLIYYGEVAFVPSVFARVRSVLIPVPAGCPVNRRALQCMAVMAILDAVKRAGLSRTGRRRVLCMVRDCDEEVWRMVKGAL